MAVPRPLDDLEAVLAETTQAVESVLEALLPLPNGPEARVVDAMRHATFAGGKRLRPFLVVACADLFDVPRAQSLRAAAAIEMVHTYSLIHDDLPAMDDDDLRRGQPTVHVMFDEATAILAGDALLTRGFETLADPDTSSDPNVRADLVLALARAAGAQGMVGGQMIDLMTEGTSLNVGQITRLQQLKTGALIGFACEAGAILGQARLRERHALMAYAHDLGLAFQIVDDLLDVEGSTAALGKRAGKDEGRGKATFVSLLGISGARQQAGILANQAVGHLDMFGIKAGLLRALASFVTTRRS